MAERIIDACCLINLYATGKEKSIFEASGGFYVSEQVQGEALRIRKIDDDDSTRLVPKEIDLTDAITTGLIHPCQFDGQDDLDSFIQFARKLDDGEASCLAIARSRGWTVASDDRKARRIASENNIALVSTPELIREWVDVTSAGESVVADVLRLIERFARFRPRRTDPLHDWWIGLSDQVELP